MVCFALACQCHALPLPCGPSLCLAIAARRLPVPLPCRRRRAKPPQGIAVPLHIPAWSFRRMGEHFHAPAHQSAAIAARTAPCSCGSMRRPAPQPRIRASPSRGRAFRCSAAANQRLALQRHSCATQYSVVAMPIFALAVLSQAMPLPCPAPLCRCRSYPCFAFAVLVIARSSNAVAALSRAFPCHGLAAHSIALAVLAISPSSPRPAPQCLR